MTIKDFTFWLEGFLSANEVSLTKQQWFTVVEKLNNIHFTIGTEVPPEIYFTEAPSTIHFDGVHPNFEGFGNGIPYC